MAIGSPKRARIALLAAAAGAIAVLAGATPWPYQYVRWEFLDASRKTGAVVEYRENAYKVGAVPVDVVVRAAARVGRRRSGQADLGAGLLQLGLRGLGGGEDASDP